MKKILIAICAVLVVGLIAGAGFSFGYNKKTDNASFKDSAYVIVNDYNGAEQVNIEKGAKYSLTKSGKVSFKAKDGSIQNVDTTNFAYFLDGSVMAFSDGVLLDFNDLSDNFINNYFIENGLTISPKGSGYSASTSMGEKTFGENLWKVSDSKYLVQSKSFKLHFSDTDIRDAKNYVLVQITPEGIVQILTEENFWMTITEEFFFETAGGVKVYPLAQYVDDGKYKISIPKLAIDDDNIVLTEAETRKQTVPTFNVVTIDGKDGTSGIDGKDGKNGKAGGGGGYGGAGTDAYPESSVASAVPTMTIADWNLTATSLQAVIKINDSAEFLAAVDDTADEFGNYIYAGQVKLEKTSTNEVQYLYEASFNNDNGNYTYSTSGTDASSNQFMGFNTAAEEVAITTVELDSHGNPVSSGSGFSINSLEPDTEYRLTITAYYKMNDTIFQREFISKTFYTDSTGISMKYVSGDIAMDASSDPVVWSAMSTINIRINQLYLDRMNKLEVYLLTPLNNKQVNAGTVALESVYEDYYVIGSATDDQQLSTSKNNYDVTFEGLPTNKEYVVRVKATLRNGTSESSDVLTTLVKDELSFLTLKKPISYDKSILPQAYFNRATGAFEIVRPVCEDPDNGIVQYHYVAYDADGKIVSERDLNKDNNSLALFYLDTVDNEGALQTYRFKVQAHFFDNEKYVVYDLGTSDPIYVEGDTLPKLTLETTSIEYNAFNGIIRITLGPNTGMNVTSTTPIKLQILADLLELPSSLSSVAIKSVEDGNNTTFVSDASGAPIYAITATQQGNIISLNMNMNNLSCNRKYTIQVSGYPDFNDGNGHSQEKILGTVSFTTKKTINLVGAFASVGSNYGISGQIRITSGEDPVRFAYAKSQLLNGSVTVALYRGKGVTKSYITSTDFTSSAALDAFFTDDTAGGYAISEADFKGVTIEDGVDYTLAITSVSDNTYKMSTGYVNYFDGLSRNIFELTAQPTPPDLITNPEKGVTATPIYNSDATKYGAEYDETLPENAVIGYRLSSNYLNVQRLAASITYYAFEYKEFYNAITTQDPIKGSANKLMTMTVQGGPAGIELDTMPSVALLFGGTKTDEISTSFWNNCYVYYTGEPNYNGNLSLNSGMGRGYRYIFAYTVQFTRSGSFNPEALYTYPYEHPDYNGTITSYMKSYGAGKENGQPLGKGIAYVLNSGMVEVPRIEPKFHTYVASHTPNNISSTSYTADGSVEVHYAYEDYDDTIVDTGSTDNRTKIFYGNNMIQSITDSPVPGTSNQWHSINLTYTGVTKAEQVVIEPTVDILLYQLDYGTILRELGYRSNEESDTTYYLTRIPVEWPWEQTISKYTNVGVSQTIVEDKNYIEIRFNGTEEYLQSIMERALAIHVTFTGIDPSTGQPINKEDGTPLFKELYMKYSQDVEGYYVRISTGLLGIDFINVTYQATVDVYIDGGTMGWDIVEDPDNKFALQRSFTSIGEAASARDRYALSTYLITNTTSSNGGLVTTDPSRNTVTSLSKLRDTVGDIDFIGAGRVRFAYSKLVQTDTNSSDSYGIFYLYAAGSGMDYSTQIALDKENLSNQMIPKQSYCLTMGFPSVSQSRGKIVSMTPTVETFYTNKNTREIEIDTIKVAAADQTAIPEKVVSVGIYATKADALALVNPIGGTANIFKIALNESGTGTTSPIFKNLEPGQTYYIALTMKIKGKDTLLMKAGASEQAVYGVSTTTAVNISLSNKAIYENSSYFNKTFNYTFDINVIYGVDIKYDIFNDVDCTSLLMGHDELTANGGILQIPVPMIGVSNKVSVMLQPDVSRQKLQPGNTYYMRMEAYASGELQDTEIIPLVIPPIGNNGALIYIKKATKDELTFWVTINDPQFSLMGTKDASHLEEPGAVYLVRFTDADGNWIKTEYDDKIYRSNIAQQPFTLSNDTITAQGKALGQKIEPKTIYQLHVFAAIDDNHDGLVNAGTDGDQNWEYYFNNSGAGIKNVINNFWEEVAIEEEGKTKTYFKMKRDIVTGTVRNSFTLASKAQTTTGEDNYYISEENAVVRLFNNKVQLILAESFGIINDGVQTFNKIEYSIDGYVYNSQATSVNVGGTLDPQSHQMFVSTTDAAGYEKYTLTLPDTIQSGEYRVTIKLYRMRTGTTPDVTISAKIG